MKEFTITAESKRELANKIATLYNTQLRSIEQFCFVFKNFEKFYYYKNANEYYVNIVDNDYYCRKARKLFFI